MSSVQDAIECPQCKGVFVTDFDCRTLEEYRHFPAVAEPRNGLSSEMKPANPFLMKTVMLGENITKTSVTAAPVLQEKREFRKFYPSPVR